MIEAVRELYRLIDGKTVAKIIIRFPQFCPATLTSPAFAGCFMLQCKITHALPHLNSMSFKSSAKLIWYSSSVSAHLRYVQPPFTQLLFPFIIV